MKEITPYLYSILFKKRIQTYEKYKEVFSKWTIGQTVCDTVNECCPKKTPEPPQDPIKEYDDNEVRDPLLVSSAPEAPPPEPEPVQYVIIEQPAPPPAPLPEPVKAPIPVRRNPTRFFPKKPDSLFWAIFVGQYGPKEYYAIEHKYKNRELEEKSAIIRFLESAPGGALKSHLKSMRITVADMKEIMGDLMIQKKMNLMVINAFVLYYKRDIWIVHEQTRSYFAIHYPGTVVDLDDIRPDGLDVPILIYMTTGGKGGSAQYEVELEPNGEILRTVKSEYFQIDKYNKVMKGMSSYKTVDLDNIVAKMQRGDGAAKTIDTNQKKQDLYISSYRILHQTWGGPIK
jgi:hypothetical protein